MGMTFDEVLVQVLELLHREGRLSYRALKRRFALDDEYLEDLKAEIIQAKRLAFDEEGAVLVWTGEGGRGKRAKWGNGETEKRRKEPLDPGLRTLNPGLRTFLDAGPRRIWPTVSGPSRPRERRGA